MNCKHTTMIRGPARALMSAVAGLVLAIAIAAGAHPAQAALRASERGVPSRAAVWSTAPIRLALASETDVRGKPPSAAALKLARRLLETQLPPRLQAELPDLAKPQAPYTAPPAPQGDDLQLWPQRKLVPAPDDPMLARLRSPFG